MSSLPPNHASGADPSLPYQTPESTPLVTTHYDPVYEQYITNSTGDTFQSYNEMDGYYVNDTQMLDSAIHGVNSSWTPEQTFNPPPTQPVVPIIPSNTPMVSSPTTAVTTNEPRGATPAIPSVAAEAAENPPAETDELVLPSMLIPPKTVWKPQQLSIDLDNFEKVSKTWQPRELEALIGYFQRDGVYAKLKLDSTAFWENMSVTVFRGLRSASACATQWKRAKNNFNKIQLRIHKTGEGMKEEEFMRSDEQWTGMRGWIQRECPYFSEIADILQRDKTFAPPMASDSAGPGKCRITRAQSTANTDTPFEWSESEAEDHPPQGGKKNPRATNTKRKRDEDNGSSLLDLPQQLLQMHQESIVARQKKAEKDAIAQERLEKAQARSEALQRELLEIKREKLRADAEARQHERELQEGELRKLEMQLRLEEMRMKMRMGETPK